MAKFGMLLTFMCIMCLSAFLPTTQLGAKEIKGGSEIQQGKVLALWGFDSSEDQPVMSDEKDQGVIKSGEEKATEGTTTESSTVEGTTVTPGDEMIDHDKSLDHQDQMLDEHKNLELEME